MMKVYRDASGAVINIGEWDYMDETVPVESVCPVSGELSILGTSRIRHNPIPDMVVVSEEEVIMLEDGGLGVADGRRG